MINYNPVTGEDGECIIVGRAAKAIYILLLSLNQKGKKVIVPANLCYAAIFPIISAGLEPIFCDVDKYSGNVTYANIKKEISEDVIAVIVPHMYGNPVTDIVKIKNKVSKMNILLIEDCASLMTNEKKKNIPGSVGDYVIYSTGYSKTIDNGIGGLLFSKKHSLFMIEQQEKKLPLFNIKFENETKLFSKIYRILRNEKSETNLKKDFYNCLTNSFKDNFLFKIDIDEKRMILNSIEKLDNVISLRREQYKLYKKMLEPKYHVYNYENGAVPWRFNILIESYRDDFVKYCLDNLLPISDWYPCVTDIFGIDKEFKSAKWHGEHIINFPLMICEDEIIRICEVLNKYERNFKRYI